MPKANEKNAHSPTAKENLEHEHHHHHEDGEECGCGHEHHHHHGDGEECGCGHEHHHHGDGEECGCGHEHHHHGDGEECGCGHEHHHHHGDGEECGCGHEHHHHHGDGEECDCGHDHHSHEHHHHHEHKQISADAVMKIYLIENLDCANCAAKIERKINELPEVEDATLTFATKQLRVTAKNPDALLDQMRQIARSVESQATIEPRPERTPAGYRSKIYLIENLDCANCAAKIERKINELPEVAEATLTFATKQLRVTAKNPDALLDQMRQIARSIESQATIEPREEKKKASEEEGREEKQTLWGILAGAALFIAGIAVQRLDAGELAARVSFLAAYIILGWQVLLTAGKNLFRGHVFDENFLMSVATLGALAIGDFAEAVGVMLFYRVGEYFEHRAVEKSRSQIMDAVDMRPEVVELVTAGGSKQIAAGQAKVGDILIVRPGDRIPLDGAVVEGESRVDTSPVTGEPVPVKVQAGDSVTSGCVNTSGLLKMRVEKPLEESMVTRILDSVENAAASKPQIDKFITRFARIYTPVVVGLALATAVVPSLVTGDWNYWVYTALSFLVISCPCALVLSVPLAFFAGIGAGSKKGILFKGGVSLEAMKNVKAVVMDKTGTITKGDFSVQKAMPAKGGAEAQLLAVAAACEKNSTHPIGVSIVAAAKQAGLELENPRAVEELAGKGIRAQLKAGQALCGNRKLMEEHQVDLSQYQNKDYGTEALIALNGKFIGGLLINDTLKEDAASAVGQIKSQGIAAVMLTGDAEQSAQAAARKAGVGEVHAQLLPEEKLEHLQQIRAKHGPVMFVGDGINDAPVLAGADVGAAMGSGADAAIEAADVVFMTSAMEAVPQSLEIARSTNRIAWQNVVFALAVKAGVMVLGLTGKANMWAAVFADTGVAMLCVLNSIRMLYRQK